MATFCTDAGHGGRDPGASWNGVLEKDLTLEYTLDINDLLLRRGHTLLTTRNSDSNVPSLSTRCKLINTHHQQGSPRFDAIISIHCNVAAYKSTSGQYVANQSARGFFGVYSRSSIRGRDLAQSIANSVSNAGVVLKNGGKMSTVELGRSLAWIHQTLPTAVLLELGFLTRPEELALLRDPAYRKKLTRAIVDGIEGFIGVT